MGAIATLFERSPESFRGFEGLETEAKKQNERVFEIGSSKFAGQVLEMIRTFTISHSHFDHIAGLVLSSAACTATKTVYGLESTLVNLEKVMDWHLWPDLGTVEVGPVAGKAFRWKE